jgi:hypothetical protein
MAQQKLRPTSLINIYVKILIKMLTNETSKRSFIRIKGDLIPEMQG